MTITVYIADDHAVVCDGLQYLLEAQGDIKVTGCAHNGRKAVSEIERLRPNIAIMDIAMPELNGIDATSEIGMDNLSTQVIVLSMYVSTERIFRALQAGARGYVLKESAGKDLIDAVRDVYAGYRYLSPKVVDYLADDFLIKHQENSPQCALDRLSLREREVCQLVVEGYSTAAIADTLCLSPKTVETYRSRLMHKLDINDLPSLVKFAIRHGLTPLG